MNGNRDGEGAGTRTWVERNKGTQDRNGGGSGNRAGTGTGRGVETRGRIQDRDGSESSSKDRNWDEYGNRDSNEDGIGEGGGKVDNRKKPHNSCRRDVGNRGDLVGRRKTRREERIGSVAADPPDKLENSKKAGGKHEALKASVSFVQVGRVCYLYRV